MEIRGNSVVTDYFSVFEPLNKAPRRWKLRPGLAFLASALVRTSARRIIVPHVTPRVGDSLEKVVADMPRILANRIKIVDKNNVIRNRVKRYLGPVYEQLDSKYPDIAANYAFNFTYKIAIASKYKAEVDLPMFYANAVMLGWLASRLKGEAKARIDELIGLWNLYETPTSINVPSIKAGFAEPSIYVRINDLLDEADMIHYSQQRFLLGIGSKSMHAITYLKKWGRDFIAGGKANKLFEVARDVVSLSTSSTGQPVTLPNISNLLSGYNPEYNPPVIDLDGYRIEIFERISPNSFPNFIMPDGTTRAVGKDWMKSYGDYSSYQRFRLVSPNTVETF